MASSAIRITPAVKRVLELFLADLTEPQWGYSIMAATDYPSGKVYQILERLEDAGWLTRLDLAEGEPDRTMPAAVSIGTNPTFDTDDYSRRLLTEILG